MTQAWHIVHEDSIAQAFDGEGARLTGGRWNSEGTRMVYTAGTLALALLEIIVHLEIKSTLKYFKAVPVSFNGEWIEEIALESLPPFWNQLPPGFSTKAIGDQWVRTASSSILRVPSAVVPNESNYLFNPQHPLFKKITIGQPINLPIDPRMVHKLK